jgi:hypothetical protein
LQYKENKEVKKSSKERWSKMTTLNKTNIGLALGISGALENRILHDWNNGGAKSTYGLSVYQRKALLRILISENPKCFCVNCLEVK